MKILLLSAFDTKGGAARAAYRLHKSLLSIGIDSVMLVNRKFSDDRTVIAPESKWSQVFYGLRYAINGIPLRRYNKKRLFTTSWLPSRGIIKMIKEIDPDVIHMHWVADDMLRIEELSKIEKPLVWSMHDMWPFTGGCHYDGSCGKYKNNCGSCPALESEKENDLSRKVFLRKGKTYKRIINQLTLIGLSQWLVNCAEESSLISGANIVNLPNPIDLTVFKPLSKEVAKGILGFSLNKKMVLFGAVYATDDPRKGFKELASAIRKVETEALEVVVFGANRPPEPPDFNYPVHYMGHYHDDLSLQILYSAADVMVIPSLQENLSNMIMESLACGTPVAAFNIGGNSDMIVHKQSGYLAKPFDPVDLARGMDWILSHPEPRLLSSSAVRKVEDCFEMKKVASQYSELYETILRNTK